MLIRAVITGQHGDAGCLHQPFGPGLVPMARMAAPQGRQSARPLLAGGGKVAVLGEETVARVDGVGIRFFGNLEHLAGVEVALPGGAGPRCQASSASRTCMARASASE